MTNEDDVVFELPETTYLGVVEAQSTKALKEQITKGLTEILKKRNIGATYVVSVSDDWSITMGRSKQN